MSPPEPTLREEMAPGAERGFAASVPEVSPERAVERLSGRG